MERGLSAMDDAVANKMLSETLLQIYVPPEAGDFFGHVLSVLEQCVPAAITGHSVFHLDSSRLDKRFLRSASKLDIPGLDELSRLVRTHPIVSTYPLRGGNPVVCTTDVIPLDAWKKTRLYNEIWRPLGMLHDTSVRFYEGSDCYTFTFCDATPLSEECRHLLEFVALHLENSYRAFKARQERLPESFPGNMVLLSAEGKVVELPPAAAALLNYYYPHEKRASGRDLPDEVEGWIQAEIRTFSSLAGTSWGGKLVARSGRRILSMSLLKSAEGFIFLLEESVAVRMFDVLVKKGLTPREAEVLMWVCQGKQNSEIALILQMSTATVRKHIEHILLKLCCETRGAAAQWAVESVNEQHVGIAPVDCLTCSRPVCLFC